MFFYAEKGRENICLTRFIGSKTSKKWYWSMSDRIFVQIKINPFYLWCSVLIFKPANLCKPASLPFPVSGRFKRFYCITKKSDKWKKNEKWKSLFFTHILTFLALNKILFSKIGPSNFLEYTETYHHAKNQKNLMSQFYGIFRTHARTDARARVNL